jgi:hypothetical protein
MRLFNTIAVFLPGFCYLGLAYIPTTIPSLHIAMFSLVGITFASAGGGFYKVILKFNKIKRNFLVCSVVLEVCCVLIKLTFNLLI